MALLGNAPNFVRTAQNPCTGQDLWREPSGAHEATGLGGQGEGAGIKPKPGRDAPHERDTQQHCRPADQPEQSAARGVTCRPYRRDRRSGASTGMAATSSSAEQLSSRKPNTASPCALMASATERPWPPDQRINQRCGISSGTPQRRAPPHADSATPQPTAPQRPSRTPTANLPRAWPPPAPRWLRWW